jgi:hypothetical protein
MASQMLSSCQSCFSILPGNSQAGQPKPSQGQRTLFEHHCKPFRATHGQPLDDSLSRVMDVPAWQSHRMRKGVEGRQAQSGGTAAQCKNSNQEKSSKAVSFASSKPNSAECER